VSETPDCNAFDVFISYAHVDNRAEYEGWVERLVTAIQEEHRRFTPLPLKVFLDLEDIRTMDDWEHRILTGLRHSRLMLAVLSPAYFQSRYCRKEWEAYCEHEVDRAMGGEGIAPIYIVKTP
jgi:hypothetical protein